MKRDGPGITGIFPIINGESSKLGSTIEKKDGKIKITREIFLSSEITD